MKYFSSNKQKDSVLQVNYFLACAVLIWGLDSKLAHSNQDLPADLTEDQIAEIDAQIERLNLSAAQALDTDGAGSVNRAPALDPLSIPAVDAGLDAGE